MTVSQNLEFKNILVKAAQESVADLHLSTGCQIKAKVDNKLVDWPEQVVTGGFLEKNILDLLSGEQKKEFSEKKFFVLVHQFADDLRFRITLFRQENKLSAILRFIPHKVRTVEELYLPKMLEKVIVAERGLVIVSGIGKTTTIAAIVEYINKTSNKTIITLEDPVEYIFVNQKSLIEQRQIGIDTPSFAQGVKDLLNIDVGVAVVDGKDYAKYINEILELSEKCLVILDLSSHNIKDAINDFISFIPAEEKQEKRQLLANNLIAILNQILVARQGGGLLPVVEILLNNSAVATAIAEDRISRIPDLIVMSGHEGMISLERSLAELVKSGEVLIDEAVKYVDDKNEFREMILK
ncbi:MAG: ATPase, T2SS/T4P/T4SS family [Patescibacteria group bacterium]